MKHTPLSLSNRTLFLSACLIALLAIVGCDNKRNSPPPAATAPAVTSLPAGVPVVQGPVETAFSLRYQEIKAGTGAAAEPNKMYKVHYTGWLASDGHKFDSSYDRPGPPLKDKDGKPVMGDDGKPKLDVPQPMQFPQGFGRVIPGFDQGFAGMKIGGQRRLFIPWQLAYGAKGRPGPDAAHPGIPEKADLIFDIELVDVTEMPAPPQRPAMGGMRPMTGGPHPGAPSPAPGAGAQPNANSNQPSIFGATGTHKPLITPTPSGVTGTPPATATPAATPVPNSVPAPSAAPMPVAPAAPAPSPAQPATSPAPALPQPK